ncbi:ABC transporter permease [Devosia rhodophyticola]|uniref:ABC transporter permease n=2 Tax=Devosia TaxID=46913 RepID=A0ABY7Z1J0_9HYPH|nr:ABC transporter permease [Devosia rhodophyticola]WDR02184.1 ABC transporter permease [Devosia algicola]WDR07153.1 ABC transporter permease [Devosia rhodophyticola]
MTLRQPATYWADQVYSATHWSILANTNRWWIDFVIVFGALSLASWPYYARLIRGTVLSLSSEDYVLAARAIGVPDIRIMTHHILPNAIGPIIVLSTYQFGAAIVAEAGLSFLGVGVQPPNTSWGSMLSRGWQLWTIAPHVMFAPAIAVALIRITFNFLGDGLNDALNPKYSKGGK